MKNQHSAFLILSEHLTGFDSVELLGTGMLDDYYVYLMENLGKLDPVRLWSIAERLDGLKKLGNEVALAREIRHSLFSDAEIEPISKNIIRLWYTGTWRQNPDNPFSTFHRRERRLRRRSRRNDGTEMGRSTVRSGGAGSAHLAGTIASGSGIHYLRTEGRSQSSPHRPRGKAISSNWISKVAKRRLYL